MLASSNWCRAVKLPHEDPAGQRIFRWQSIGLGAPRHAGAIKVQLLDCLGRDVVVLTVLHKVRKVERIIADLTPAFLAEIAYYTSRRKD